MIGGIKGAVKVGGKVLGPAWKSLRGQTPPPKGLTRTTAAQRRALEKALGVYKKPIPNDLEEDAKKALLEKLKKKSDAALGSAGFSPQQVASYRQKLGLEKEREKLREVLEGRSPLQRFSDLSLGMKTAAGLGAADLALFGTSMVGAPLVKGVANQFGVGYEDAVRQQARQQAFVGQMERRRRELAVQMEKNAIALAARDPQMVVEVLYGGKLPMGARVVGGQPRVGDLEELAYGMTTGAFEGSMMSPAQKFAAGMDDNQSLTSITSSQFGP